AGPYESGSTRWMPPLVARCSLAPSALGANSMFVHDLPQGSLNEGFVHKNGTGMPLDGINDPPALVNKRLVGDFNPVHETEFVSENVLGNHTGRFGHSRAIAFPDAVFQAALDQVVCHLSSVVLMVHRDHEQVQVLAQA